MNVGVDQERHRRRGRYAFGQRHGFGGGGRLVQERGIGDVERRQITYHGLKIQQRLESPLADFGLIGRIRGVPGGVLQNIAQDHRWHDRAVVPHADQRRHDQVLIRKRLEVIEGFALR